MGSRSIIVLSAAYLAFVGCAVTTVRDQNLLDAEKSARAPSGSPSAKASSSMPPSAELIDSTFLQTKADFHFSRGEAFSLEGDHTQAVQEFRSALIYDQNSLSLRLRLSREFVRIGLVGEALKEVQFVLEKEPNRTEAVLLSAGLYSSMKLYDQALEQYKKILDAEPDHIEAQVYVGALLVEQKKFKQAIQYFSELSKNKKNPKPQLAHFYAARVYQEMNDKDSLKKAQQSLLAALKIQPDFSDAVVALGAIYESQNQTMKAMELYKDYQTKSGPNLEIAEQLSRLYLDKSQFQEAIEQLETLESADASNLNVKLKMAFALIETKSYKEAISRLEEIVARAPDADKIRFYLGAVYEEVKNYPAAITHFVKIAPESQYYGDAVVHTAYLYKLGGQLDEAIKVAEKNKSLLDVNPQLIALYTSMLEEKKEYPKALAILKEAVKKFPTHTQLFFFLGSLYDRDGDLTNTVSSLKTVLELDPNHIQGLNFLAYIYAQNNFKLDEAEALVRRALKIRPDDGYVLDTLGWVLFKRGKVEDAVQTLEKAHAIEVQEPVISEHLGDAYSLAKLPEKAIGMYMKAAESERNADNLKKIQNKIDRLQSQSGPEIGSNRVPAQE